MKSEEQKAITALKYILPLLEKYNFTWIITGGFACYTYGVSRNLTDIDIDIDTDKDSPEFKKFMGDVKKYITQPLEHFVDQNYDNYNFEMTYKNVVIDICPLAQMNIFNKKTNSYEHFYKNGAPKPEIVDFHGLKLPLLPKELVIKNKEMLVWQRESDRKDIEALEKMLNKKTA